MYRQIDEDVIVKNLDKLEDGAKTIYMNKYEPTIDEYRRVYHDILLFIKDRKRIVYGGYAQNSLIVAKKRDDAFYKDSDMADIEFYTPDPIGDTIDLCDILHKKYKYVEGKEGVHHETYKIFVNFINYCDISYMPESIYKTCPHITVDGIMMTHPHFMLIDAYRVYSDPMTSYFRLRKTFVRFNKMMKHYPLDEDMIYNKGYPVNDKSNNNVLRYIRKNIIHDSKLIVVGHYAFNQLMKKAKMPATYMIDTSFYQLISTNYDEDIKNIIAALKSKYNNMIYKRYYPFFQFLDRSTEFYLGDVLVLKVYGANDRCIVHRYSKKKKTYFGTYQLIFMYNLIQYNIGKIRHNEFNEMLYGSTLVRMMKARDKYLTERNLTALDESLFQEFTFNCIGEPKDLLRSSFLEIMKKREQGKQVKFLYKPRDSPGKKPNFRFSNSSGEIV